MKVFSSGCKVRKNATLVQIIEIGPENPVKSFICEAELQPALIPVKCSQFISLSA
jgi:hypothetical protein